MTVQLGASGRLVLPAQARKRLRLKPGSVLNVAIKQRSIILKKPLTQWRKIQTLLKPFRPQENKLLSEEPIQDRRRAARKGE